MLPVLYFFMKVSGMIRLNTAEYAFILLVVFLNFNLSSLGYISDCAPTLPLLTSLNNKIMFNI